MPRRLSILAGSMLLVTMAQAATLEAGCFCCCKRPACDRGVAILSPLESPDPCEYPVGGEYRYTPYYQGYAIDRNCLPPLYGTVTSYPYPAPVGSTTALGGRSAPYGRSNFGAFSGASQDESGLLHLGGFGPGSNGSNRPYQRSSDIIDRIQGNR